MFKIMGILNLTPDSFYDGGRYKTMDDILRRVEEMVEDGAGIIDVGGQSTRPGSEEIPVDEEIRRIKGVIKEIKKRFPVLVSVDTYRSEVAYQAFDEGADILNDISGFSFDERILKVAADFSATVIIGHTTGKPKYMMERIIPDDKLIPEMKAWFSERIKMAESYGLKVWIDPCLGFGKTPKQNLMIINRLQELLIFGKDILIGPSMKSFIGYVLSPQNPLPPSERLEGTIASCIISFLKGAKIFRVHHVKEVARALKVTSAIITENLKTENK